MKHSLKTKKNTVEVRWRLLHRYS